MRTVLRNMLMGVGLALCAPLAAGTETEPPRATENSAPERNAAAKRASEQEVPRSKEPAAAPRTTRREHKTSNRIEVRTRDLPPRLVLNQDDAEEKSERIRRTRQRLKTRLQHVPIVYHRPLTATERAQLAQKGAIARPPSNLPDNVSRRASETNPPRTNQARRPVQKQNCRTTRRRRT